jgi:hypothetical protein
LAGDVRSYRAAVRKPPLPNGGGHALPDWLSFVLLALFTIVQYNDPDAIPWVPIYGLPTIWAGFAAYRPSAFAHNQLFLGLFGLNILAVGAGAIYMWPSEVSTWWGREEVREGLG